MITPDMRLNWIVSQAEGLRPLPMFIKTRTSHNKAYVRSRQNVEDMTPFTDASGPHLVATPPLCSSGATGILAVAVSSLFRLNRLMNGSVALDYARKRVGVVGPKLASSCDPTHDDVNVVLCSTRCCP